MVFASSAGVLGTLPGWLTLGVLVGAAWSFRRGGGGSAISSLETANRVLEKANHELGEKVESLTKEVAVLRGRTDVAEQVRPLREQLAGHETRAQERHESAQRNADDRNRSLLNVLDLIAERLGPDSESRAT